MNEIARQAAQLADLDRRLRQVEGGQRSGLSSTVADFYDFVFNVPASTTPEVWYDDAGNSTPTVTLRTGSRVEIRASCIASGIGRTAGGDTFKSEQFFMGVKVDGVDPPVDGRLGLSYTGEGWDSHPITLLTGRDDLVPGEHTFDLAWYAFENSPGGSEVARVATTYLSVTPLGWG